METYYNDIDKFCCKVIDKNIERGNLPKGVVDNRDIKEVQARELMGYQHVHLYCGVGAFPLAFERCSFPIHLRTITAGFPCFVAGTLILSERGYVPIESLSVGDKVLTHKGRWQPVTAVMQRTDAPLRKVFAGGCSGIVTTDEHPFFARSRGWSNTKRRTFTQPEWTEAKDLTTNHFVAQMLPEEQSSRDNHTDDFWWVVGRYIADGWRVERKDRTNSGRVVICSSYAKAELLSDKITCAGFHATRVEERTVVKFHISNNEFYHFLQPFGHLAHNKLLPGWVFELGAGSCAALLDGYLAGDGYRDNRNPGPYWRATTVSKALAYSVALLAQRAYGVVASIRSYAVPDTTIIEGRTVRQRTQWIVCIPDSNRSAFIEGPYGWKEVRSSEPCGMGTVYNIAVSEDESYLAEGAIVHNCQPHSFAGARRASADERDLWGETLRIVCGFRPDYLMVENVFGILSSENGQFFGRVLRDLAQAGYDAEWQVLSAASFGPPHMRERLFLVAYPVALTSSQRCQEQQETNRIYTELDASNLSLANTDIGSQRFLSIGTEETYAQAGCGSSLSGLMEHANGQRQQERQLFRGNGQQGQSAGRHTASYRTFRGLERRLGGVPYGFPYWLDKYRWPSGPSQPQHAWEPPRITEEKQINKTARLKALGNAICVVCAEYIARCIKQYEEEKVEGCTDGVA